MLKHQPVTAGNIRLKAQDSFFADPRKSFVRVQRGGGFDENPADGVRAIVSLQHPSSPIEQITVFQGSLKLKVAKETKEVVLKDIASLAGKAINNPVLRDAKVRMKVTKDNFGLKISLPKEFAEKIGKVEPVDADGKKAERVNLFQNRFGDEITYQLNFFGSEPPKGLGLKITVNVSLETLTIPFKFENIPVPPVPRR
jgi:hypothetical protein